MRAIERRQLVGTEFTGDHGTRDLRQSLMSAASVTAQQVEGSRHVGVSRLGQHAVGLLDDHGEQRPFGYYQIRRQSDRLAIGGVGFKGPPDGGVVEIGDGLVPSARGHGYATEALGTSCRLPRVSA